jgi:MFS transporter, OFA family, oxalate/formate antiporter
MKKIYYGWWMVLGMVLMYAATNGIAMYAFSVMRPLQIRAFGLDPQSAAFLPTILFVTVALVSPFAGRLFDRFDTRRLIIWGTFAIIALTFGQVLVPNYGVLIVYYALFGTAMTFVGIISFMYLINHWFNKYRGLAAGILLLGSSLGGIVFPKIAASAGGDWQQACFYLGIACAVFMLPPLLLIKNRPSDVGSYPDGIEPTDNHTKKASGGSDMTLKQALASPTFYLVLFVTGVLWFCINGYIQNHGFIMKDLGLDAPAAAKVLGVFSSMAILGKLLFGFLSDKFDRKYIMVLSIITMTASVFILQNALQNSALLTPFALVFGLGFGGAFTIIQVWVSDIYAGRSFGAILGFVTMVDTLAGSAGMITLGSMRKASDSYAGSLNLLLILCGIAIVSAFLVKKPVSHLATDPQTVGA